MGERRFLSGPTAGFGGGWRSPVLFRRASGPKAAAPLAGSGLAKFATAVVLAAHGAAVSRLRSRTVPFRRCHRIARSDGVPGGNGGCIAPAAPGEKDEVGLQEKAEDSAERIQTLTIVVLCFFVTLICALDRAAMSVAIVPMAMDFGYSDADKGLVGSAYFWGYTVSNLVSALLCTAISPRLLLASGVIVWSLFTVLTPSAAYVSLPTLLACRAAMGASEGICLPGIQALLANWVSKEERSRAVSFVFTGLTIGTLAALFLSPQLNSNFGWPSIFLAYGSAGFLWFAAWLPVSGDRPKSAEAAVPYTCEYACEFEWATVEKANAAISVVPWGQLFSSRQVQGTIVMAMAHNTSVLLLLAWLPQYFNYNFSLSVAEASMLAAPPWAMSFIIGNAAGWGADALTARGVELGDIRRGVQLLGSLGPALCLWRISMGFTSQLEATVWFSLVLGLSSCSYAGFNASPQDLGQRYAPVVYGIINACGSLAGALAVWLTGEALDALPHNTGFTLVFQVAAAVYAVGGAVFWATYHAEREFD